MVVAAVNLQTENETLRERVRQLEKLLNGELPLQPVFGLTKTESAMLNILVSRPMVSKEHFIDEVYFTRPNSIPNLEIVNVYICRIRKVLKPFGIKIDTIWGQGYCMSAADQAKVREYANQYKGQAA